MGRIPTFAADIKSTMHKVRFYRDWTDSGLINFTARDRETDIFVSADKNLKVETENLIRQCRSDIIGYIKKNPLFEKTLEPLPFDEKAPEIVKSMLKASEKTGVGPMAAVAGAISEFAGKGLLRLTKEVILENGGDIFIKSDKETRIGIYAGSSPLSGKIAIKVDTAREALGVCTSSGTVGHSLSFGKADAVTVVARDTALADACATASCNRVKKARDIERALDFAKSVEGILGAVVIYKAKIGTIGQITLV